MKRLRVLAVIAAALAAGTAVATVGTPTGLVVQAVAPGQLSLSWSAVAGATNHLVSRGIVAGGPYSVVASTSGTSIVDTGLVNGAAYFYVVAAQDGSGTGSNSTEASGTVSVTLGPYAPDTNTLVLLHFDEPGGGSATTNHGTLGLRAFTVSLGTALTNPPPVTNVLGAGAYAGFGSAASFATGQLVGLDFNNSGAYDGGVNGTTLSADRLAMSALNMGGASSWTLEALIRPTVTNVNQEIITTDSDAAARGFQFRINTAGQLELNLIATGPLVVAPIPSTGTHAFASGQWFHVAASYDGETVRLFWTRLDPALTNANRAGSAAASIGAFGNATGPLCIGNENRNIAGEYFQGRIDEVRISGVARSAFLMDRPVPAPPGGLTATSGNAQVVLNWPAVATANGYYVRRSTANGGPYTSLALVTTTTWTDVTAGNGTNYYYVVASVGAGGTGSNSAQVLGQPWGDSGPLLTTDTRVSPTNVYAGGPVRLSAGFTGTGPIAYQWFFVADGGAPVPIPDATGTTYFIARSETNQTGRYFVTASNNPPGLGSQTLSSTPAPLTVRPIAAPASGLFCNLLEHPEQTVVSDATPAFGWFYPAAFRNDHQTGYRLIVSSSRALAEAGTGDLWDSGFVNSSNSINVSYAGAALQPNTTCFWRVQTLDSRGRTNFTSMPQPFHTASQLVDPVAATGMIHRLPADGSANAYPLRYVPVTPVSVTTNSPGRWFVDFGRDAFGYATVRIAGTNAGATIGFGLGELATGSVVNTSPGATIRYRPGSFLLQSGDVTYTARSTVAVGSISPPAGAFGLVTPFRYLELTGLPANVTLTTNDVTQWRLQTEADEGAAAFTCSSPALNQIWEFCRYSMIALTFDGIYVDGDRERLPYEADSYIQQLGSYSCFNDFTLPRCTFEYLIDHLTWPTEWPLHMPLIAWADYEQTGDPYLIAKYYGALTNRCLLAGRASAVTGLVRSYPYPTAGLPGNNAHTTPSDIIDWYQVGSDGVRNDDGFVQGHTNAVLNAFYFRCLTVMARMAQLTGRTNDANNFAAQAGLVFTNYNQVFWTNSTQSYVDGYGTTHAAAHANFLPLVFGLVPSSNQWNVVQHLRSRIAATNGMPAGVYGAQYLLEALFQAGDSDTALGLMMTNGPRSWLNMIASGSTLATEAWSTANKSNQDWNHAWGAAPANLIPRYVLGLRPLAPGFGQVIIQPHLGTSLSHAQGVIPTIRGPVSIQATHAAGQFRLLVDVPGNVLATLMIPATNTTALLDGAPVTGALSVDALSNTWLTVTNVGSGRHALWSSSDGGTNAAELYANWAAAWFGASTTNSALTGATADPDGDGASNGDEFVAGTGPLDGADFFHYTALTLVPGPSIGVSFSGVGGRRYTLQHAAGLAPAVWTNGITQTAAFDNEPLTLTGPPPTNTPATFLRVLLTFP